MVKQTVWGGAAAAAALVLLLAAAPFLADQALLRPWVAPLLQRALRQGVAIDGPITIALVPTPRVTVEQVTLTRSGRIIAVLPRVEASLRIVPLLWGRLQADQIRLIHPDLRLAAMTDPRPPAPPAPESPAQPVSPGIAVASAADGPVAPPSRLARLVVEQGTASLPGFAGQSVRLSQIDLLFERDDSHARVTGQLRLDNQAIALAAGADWRDDRLIATDLTLTLPQGGELHWSGSGDPFAPSDSVVSGKISARIDSLAKLTKMLPALPASLTAPLSITPDAIETGDALLTLGDDDWRGKALLSRGALPHLEVSLQGRRLDLQHLPAVGIAEPIAEPIAGPAAAPAATVTAAAPAATVTAAAPAASIAPAAAAANGTSAAADAAVSLIPRDLSADVTLAIDEILWRGQSLRDAHLALSAANGDVTVSQASIGLPGNSQMALFGVLSAGPRFEGSFEAKSDDIRELVGWAGVTLPQIPADRLRVARLAGRITATPAEVALQSARLKIDSSQIDLAATYRPGPRPALGVTFSLDLLNADAYWPASAAEPAPAAATDAAASVAAPSAAASDHDATIPERSWDANIKGHIGRLSWQGRTAQDLSLSAGLAGDEITLSPLTIGDLAGAQWSMTGKIARIDGAYHFAPAHIDLRSPDLARTLRGLGVDLPLSVPVDLAADLSGPLAAPQIILSAPQLQLGKTRLEPFKATLVISPERLLVDPISAGLYGGQLTGKASLSRGKGDMALTLTLTDAKMRQALLEVADIGLADGALEGEIALTSSGPASSDLKAHLAGTAAFAVRQGRIRGFDLKSANDRLAGQPGIGGVLALLQAGLTGGATQFASLSGSATIDQGVIDCRDLRLVAEGGGGAGTALINLPLDTIDAHADLTFANAPKAPVLVMRLSGSLQSPRRTIEFKSLQQWLAENGVKTGKPKDVLKGLLQGLIK